MYNPLYMTMRDPDIELIDAMTIKVETFTNDEYLRIHQICKNGNEYTVRQEDAAEAMLLIAQLYKDYNLTYTQIYPVQWKQVRKSGITSLDSIAEDIKKLAIQSGTIEPESTKGYSK